MKSADILPPPRWGGDFSQFTDPCKNMNSRQ
jgi:hypothetical protein